MPVSTRLIKRRIKSVTNTKKITKAMELVAASKMRRAVAATIASRPYVNLGKEMIQSLTGMTDPGTHPLLQAHPELKKILVILISSDRGLAGAFNAQLLKTALQFIKEETGRGLNLEYITVGKKGQDAIRRMGGKIVATFLNLANNPRVVDIRPMAELVMREFIEGNYGQVYLIYTDFISSLRQVPRVIKLLPIRKEELAVEKQGTRNKGQGEFLFEPDASIVLSAMLPRMVEAALYQAVLESVASEHSARMVAMRSATDSAGEMIDDLTFTFNQARQASITREISEIAAGKAALE